MPRSSTCSGLICRRRITPPSRAAPIHLLVDSTGLKLCGPGEWLIEKHGTRKRRSWHALHIGMDAGTGRIVAATLTERGVDDASQVGPLLDQIPGPVASVTGDGAYDRSNVYAAVLSDTAETAPTQRHRHIQTIAEKGRLAWQRSSGDNKRAGVENQMARWKGVLGEARRFHSNQAQATEVAIGVAVLNRMLDLGPPNSVRVI